MAEVVGIVSAGVGIASFAVQVFGNINALNATYQYNRSNAPRKIIGIVDRLEFLKLVLERLQPFEGNPIVDHVVEDCKSTFSEVEGALHLLLEKVHRKSTRRKTDWKSVKLQISGQFREEIEEIRSELDRMTTMLDLLSSVCVMSPVSSDNETQKTIDFRTPHSIPSVANNHNPADDGDVYPAETDGMSIGLAHSYSRCPPIVQRTSCIMNRCHCSCHFTKNVLGRYWWSEYTPMSIILGKCDNQRCDMRNIRWNLRLAFNRFSIPWAISINLEIILGAETYSLRPALSLQRVVNYTSPGFETIWKWSNHLIQFSEAQDQLRRLDKSPSPLRQHINPAGNNYVRELLYHGPRCDQDEQFALLSLLVNELGITLENEDVKFLTKCASWVGEGRHLDLLHLILKLGFDCSSIDSPLFQDWPTPCSPGWVSEEITPDPFFLKYLAYIAKEASGFGGSTPLQDAVLCGSKTAITTLLSKTSDLESHRNFLGQTPLHLAVSSPHIFAMILDAGHDLNVTDRWGITPLMYAAAMGIGDVVQLLISEGANITTRATRYERDFMHFASVRGHWDIILESLKTIRSYYTERTFQLYVRKAFCHLVSNDTWLEDMREVYFERLAELCADVNFTFGDSLQGTEGELPSYSIARRRPNADLFRYCMDNGTDVNHVDHRSRTVIFELFQHLEYLHFTTWDTVDSIKLCLERGINISHGDTCSCACSINGCNTTSTFNLSFTYSWSYRQRPGFMWTFEWLSLIEEFYGYEESKSTILSLIRRTRFDILGITHVCCHRGEGLGANVELYFEPSPKDVQEVPDEDLKLIELLNEEMQENSSKSLDTLKYEWMILLKQRYNNKVAKDQEQRKREVASLTSGYVVDYKNDTYQHNLVVPACKYEPLAEMSHYAFWLQHEYLRTLNARSKVFKDGWYERRTKWVAELLRVMGISKQKMKQAIKRIRLEETTSEKTNLESIVEQFLTSMKAS